MEDWHGGTADNDEGQTSGIIAANKVTMGAPGHQNDGTGRKSWATVK